MKILVTGTHFTTAVAVIEELKKQQVEIIYVGRKNTQEGDPSPSAESQILPQLGVKFISIVTGRLQRLFTIYTIPSLLKIPIGLIQAIFILFSEKPDVVLSFGGYVAVPVVISAWLMSIPVIIHEQTLVSGLANLISSWFADKVAISFDTIHSFNESKIVLTGNPMRSEITQGVNLAHPGGVLGRHLGIIKVAKREKLPIILITGGNQGSHAINLAVEGCLDKLLKRACVIHQTGESKFKDYERLKKRENERYQVEKWIDDMGWIMRNSDLIVSRAGINTLTELAYFGIPTLVIPVPYLYKDEQNVNAKFFENLGLVKILPQSKLSNDNLLENIKDMLQNLDQLKKEAKKAKSVVIPDAAKRLTLETLLLAKLR